MVFENSHQTLGSEEKLEGLKKEVPKDARRNILIAAGGTGGHLYPAQALSRSLLQQEFVENLLFAGHDLSTNKWFLREEFEFVNIRSGAVYGKGLLKKMRSFLNLAKGIRDSLKLVRTFQPDLVVGFGSFHSFPILFAAWMRKVPVILFESNSIPGKVIKMFSGYAAVTAIQFPQAARFLKGKSALVELPLWNQHALTCSLEEARQNYQLENHKRTILIFGGSQGAVSINRVFLSALSQLNDAKDWLQIIHICGEKENIGELRVLYERFNIRACVKAFEDKMHFAWKCADLVICRSGAATLAEQIFFEVPAVLIPYPHAADDHQSLNAEFIRDHVKGALVIAEAQLEAQALAGVIKNLFDSSQEMLEQMKTNIREFKKQKNHPSFFQLIGDFLQSKL